MIAHNYAQTLEICDRVVLMQHGEITFESATAATSAAELLEIVRREYRALRDRVNSPPLCAILAKKPAAGERAMHPVPRDQIGVLMKTGPMPLDGRLPTPPR